MESNVGFRLQLNLIRPNEEIIKCFIFVNLKKLKYIVDLEEHIKSVLGLQIVSLFINDTWLPSNETIHIIEVGDTVIAKTASAPNVLENFQEPTIEEVPPKKRKKKINIDDNLRNIEVQNLYKELLDKKNQLLNKNGENTAPMNNSTSSIDCNPPMEDSQIFPSPPPVKRKRIRKHKKKTIVRDNELSMVSSNDPYVLKEISPNYASGKHTRFIGEVQDDIDKVEEDNDNIPNDKAEMDSINEEVVNSQAPVLDSILSNQVENCAGSKNLPILPLAERDHLTAVIGTDTLSGEQVNNGTSQKNGEWDSSDLLEDEWKTKLLNLAKSTELESKIFYRKFPKDETPVFLEIELKSTYK